MNRNRKLELMEMYLLQTNEKSYNLSELNLTEILYLKYTVEYLKEKKEFNNIDYDYKIKSLNDAAIEKIKKSKTLYIVYDKNTNYPFVDFDYYIWMFSTAKYAYDCIEFHAKKSIYLKIIKLEGEEILKEFNKFSSLGIKNILFDNGKYSSTFKINELIDIYDECDTLVKNKLVINPKLQKAIIEFHQHKFCKYLSEENKEFVDYLEAIMIQELLYANFLLPAEIFKSLVDIKENELVILNNGTPMKIFTYIDSENYKWINVFTDLNEFNKVFDIEKHDISIISFDNLVNISENDIGIIINSNGIPIKLNKNNINFINKIKKDIIKIDNNLIN